MTAQNPSQSNVKVAVFWLTGSVFEGEFEFPETPNVGDLVFIDPNQPDPFFVVRRAYAATVATDRPPISIWIDSPNGSRRYPT